MRRTVKILSQVLSSLTAVFVVAKFWWGNPETPEELK